MTIIKTKELDTCLRRYDIGSVSFITPFLRSRESSHVEQMNLFPTKKHTHLLSPLYRGEMTIIKT